MYINTVKIKAYEKGLLFADNEFKKILGRGRHWYTRIIVKRRVDVVSMREPWLCHEDLDVIIASGALGDEAKVLDLADSQRALVWIDRRFSRVLGPGQYVLWDTCKEIDIEVITPNTVHFVHDKLDVIVTSERADRELDVSLVEQGRVGILFVDGQFKEILRPGLHAFWRRMGKVKVLHVDMRETILDISGQEIMTSDKVTLRLNGLCTFRVKDPVLAVTAVEDFRQALYREAQLALRALVGTVELDALLADKDILAQRIQDTITGRVADFGVEMIGFGIRDIILPGEMKDLLNKVVESKKMAEANLITRREETAAMRSQANTARMLSGNQTLMRLKELEVLEKIATSSSLSVVCGEKGLSDKVLKLI